MKYCPRCKTTRTREEFHKASGRRDGLQPFCKLCKKEIDARTYAEGGIEYRRRKKGRERQHARANARRLLEYLSKHPCIDCGESDPLVLHFDHVRGSKRYNLGDLVRINVAWRPVEAEVDKCEVRCANCHLRKTVAKQGTLRYLLVMEMQEAGQRASDSDVLLPPSQQRSGV